MIVKITAQNLITVGAVLSAVIAIAAYFVKIHNWYLKLEAQNKDIKATKKEQTMVIYALSACLDGLQQLGANSAVTAAKDKLDKFINQQAHDQLE